MVRVVFALVACGVVVACGKNADDVGRKLDDKDDKIERLGGLTRDPAPPPEAAPRPVPQRACYDQPALEATGGVERRGRLRWADDLDKPPNGARVLAYAVDGPLVARAVTDDAGGFVLRAPAIHVHLVLCHRGARDQMRNQADTGAPFGDRFDDLDLGADRDAPIGATIFPEGVVGGRVLGAGGEPAAGVRVEVRSQSDRDAVVAGEATSDADGRFAIGGLNWDIMTVAARTATEAGTFEGQPRWNEPLVGVVRLAPAGSLEVKLAGAPPETCARNAVVLRYREPDARDLAFAAVDAGGVARFAAMVPGRYRLSWSCSAEEHDVDLRAGAPLRLACVRGEPACVTDR